MGSGGPWHIRRATPVRADAEGLFVPASDLPEAATGDRVVLAGPDGVDERSGVIVELTDDGDRTFFRLRLD
jgi:hypothetical protein